MIGNASVFYHIYPLGALGVLESCGNRGTISRLLELATWIPHLKALGVNAVYLGPVFDSDFHGYDTRDYRRVDPRLGTNENLAELVARCHEAGIDVVLDAVFNHSGRNFFAFRDVIERRERSPHGSWYRGIDFSVPGPMNDGFSYEGWAGFHDLAKFEVRNPEVSDYLCETAEFWIREFGIDGLRLDAADVIDRGFLKTLSSRCKAAKPGFWLMGEMVHGDYRELLDSANLDSVTNYECYKGLWSSCNDVNMHEIAYSLNRQFGHGGVYRGRGLYSFLDNHDVDRVCSALTDRLKVFPLYCLLFSMPGIPSLYYGSEWLETGRKADGDATLRGTFGPTRSAPTPLARELSEALSRLARMRGEILALRDGDYTEIGVTSETLSFRRECSGGAATVAVNIGAAPVRVMTGMNPGARLRDVLNHNDVTVESDGCVSVWANWARVLTA